MDFVQKPKRLKPRFQAVSSFVRFWMKCARGCAGRLPADAYPSERQPSPAELDRVRSVQSVGPPAAALSPEPKGVSRARRLWAELIKAGIYDISPQVGFADVGTSLNYVTRPAKPTVP